MVLDMAMVPALFADYGIPSLPLFPDQASRQAVQVDHLFFAILAITGLMGLLVTTLLLVFSARYRRRTAGDLTPPISGYPLLEWSWTLMPMVVFAFMFGWGVLVYGDNFNPPPDSYEVFVVGKQWMWKLQHPGGQREINELHIAVGKPVKVTLISEDVVHDFGVPAFRQKIDVLPGRYVSTWYLPSEIGTYHLFCNQYCGTEHASMIGSIIVMRPDEHVAWLQNHVDGSAAYEGRKLFLKLQCISCHRTDAQQRAPLLEGLYGRTVTLKTNETVVADADYIRTSILYPARQVVQGWDPIMPTFQGKVSEDEVLQLIAYIRSLGTGIIPRPNNDSPPPVGAPTEPESPKKGEGQKK
jgi:cytochrome c oxidase subunit 2